jgi:hypothetical protein
MKARREASSCSLPTISDITLLATMVTEGVRKATFSELRSGDGEHYATPRYV